MKVTITRACGHEEVIQVFGKSSSREWRIAREEEKICSECLAKQRAEETEKAAEEAKKAGLPALIGTPKQIAWAETIRKDAIQTLEDNLEEIKVVISKKKDVEVKKCQELALDQYMKEVYETDSARWFIEHRDIAERWGMDQHLTSISLHLFESGTYEGKTLKSAENPKDGKVILSIDKALERIYAEKAYDESFIKICHKHRMHWNGTSYVKTVETQDYSFLDAAADLANDLLLDGHAVEIKDNEVAKMVETGHFLPAAKRWMGKLVDKDMLVLGFPKNDKEAEKGLERLGRHESRKDYEVSKYYLEPKKVDAILEYAEILNFKVSASAKKLLKKYSTKDAVLIEAMEKREELTSLSDHLKDVLDSSREVLDDLKD